jgi:hypothetical protein
MGQTSGKKSNARLTPVTSDTPISPFDRYSLRLTQDLCVPCVSDSVILAERVVEGGRKTNEISSPL